MTDASTAAVTPSGTARPYADLHRALTVLRDALAGVRLPLEAGDAPAARSVTRKLLDQFDDYVLPRLARIDAPLLAVVGGSTGAGKSTLVNSLVGAQVSTAGVLRPTTRGPVLVHHPDDAPWFADQRLLPGLARSTGGEGDARSLRLAPHPASPRGIALLDAPDIDSVVTANRELAGQLLAAADLWVFLTTAARYADAVPWGLLRDAAERSAAVAVVLDRVPPEAVTEIQADLAAMLRAQGLGSAPLFVIAESRLTDGRLPDEAVRPLRDWLHGLASDAAARGAVARATLTGVLATVDERAAVVLAAVQAQQSAASSLRADAATAYDDAAAAVDAAMRDGSLLRGEVLARWQDVVGTGDLLRGLQTGVGRLRDRLTAAVRGRPRPADELTEALETGVAALVHAESDRAAEATVAAWRRRAPGRALLERDPRDKGALDKGMPMDRSDPALTGRVERMVRDWQGAVLELVRQEGAGRRRTAQFMAYGVNGAALTVMVAVFASTGGLTGGEVAVAGGASALSQKVLEALLGDQAVRSLAARARIDLRERVEVLLVQERARFTDLLSGLAFGTSAETLTSAAADASRTLEQSS